MAKAATKKCPYCAEDIKQDAIKCKHCGTTLIGDTGTGSVSKTDAKARNHSSYGGFTALAIIAPLIGVIIGIVYLTKSDVLDRKVGEHTLALSILFGIIWFFVLSALGSSATTTPVTTY